MNYRLQKIHRNVTRVWTTSIMDEGENPEERCLDIHMPKAELEEKLKHWKESGELIQDVFPDMGKDEREFLLDGILPDEWERLWEFVDEYR